MKYLVFIVLLISLGLTAQEKWTPEDILSLESASSVTFSPDNTMIAWTKRKSVKKSDKFVRDIYISYLKKLDKHGMPTTIQMTRSDENDYSPIFSNDSKHLYFLSGREKGKKLWRFNLLGGEPEALDTFENGISSLQWKDEHTLLFISNDGKTLYEKELEKKKDNVIVVEDSSHWKISRIYAYDIKEKTTTRVTDNQYPVSSYQVSRDGKFIFSSQTRSRHYSADAQPDPHYFLHDLSNGTSKRILENLEIVYNIQFTENNQGFYLIALHNSDPQWNGAGVGHLYSHRISDGSTTRVPLNWENESNGSYTVVGNNVIATLPNGPTNKLAFISRNGSNWSQQILDFEDKNEHVSIQSIARDFKKAAYVHSTASQPPRYYISDLDVQNGKLVFSKELEWIKLNKKIAKKPIAQTEIVRWKGYNGDEVNGILYYPQNYQKGRKYPLFVSIHGGPAGVDMDTWRESWAYFPQIVSQMGAFILRPNYHGSSNHGLEFVESIKKNYYTPELKDITSGIYALRDKGMIDMDSLAVTGWSNGAILATMLTVQYPDLFKVAAPGAGDVNWTSDFGTCRFGVSFDQSYFGGAPWDNVNGKTYNEKYITLSPLFEIEKIKTPTIIFHGSEDRAVPRDQGWEYYRGLQQVGRAPVRFLWFPGQPHSLQKITHQLRKMKEEIRWINYYLFGKEDEKNEAFKNDSPLALMLKKQKAASSNGVWGRLIDNQLTPEVVEVHPDSLAIGRFEVTNAQYQALVPEHDFPDGQNNNPAIVSLKAAKKYISLLNNHLQESYRLPNEKESAAWHKKAHKQALKENSLNYWAGYELTPDEVQTFRLKVAELNSTLYKPVASFSGVKLGKEEVFDLAGNAVEFTHDGSAYGYSAYDYVDKTKKATRSKPAKAGFRIVKSLK